VVTSEVSQVEEPLAETPTETPAVEEAKPKPAFRPKFKRPTSNPDTEN
jgi:hypothetical protein